ncbi:DUF4097 family beta strand repeat-containing protein [Paenibacillus tuaregi]|uniref:DUF4097 family beta strand repeat-containing protein n=1 Tax=Paenibacillus tuaregi TaxID=1816681 RepID=UPI000B0B98E2|nr:DUF4097 family beta strand repeat-containing protein [Paenibacillus tuaregi]
MSLNLPPESGGEAEVPAAKRGAGFKPRRRKRKFIAGLLAALFPGLGHLYLRLFRKGIFLIYLIVLDVSAILYFSSAKLGVNVPWLILLGLLIPIVYFYSVYDVLQNTDTLNGRRLSGEIDASRAGVFSQVGYGLLLIAGGVLVFLFHVKPPWLAWVIQYGAGYIAAAVLIACGIGMAVHEARRRLVRTGRFTASAVMAVLGVLILLDQWAKQDYIIFLLNWWPVILILLGIEYIILFLWKRWKRSKLERRFRLDIKGLIVSAFIGFSVFAVTQQDHYLHLWNRVSLDLTAAGTEFSDEKGYSETREPIKVPVDLKTSEVMIDGINGKIEVERGAVEEIVVKSKVWIDGVEASEAEKIAKDLSVQVTEGARVGISVKDRTYGTSGSRHPRVNLTIIVPENRKFDFNISTTSGGISLANLQAVTDISLQTGRGNIYMSNVTGDVTAKTLSGRVELHNVIGKVDAESLGGKMIGMDIFGPLKLNTMIGDITVIRADDDITANTRNGNVSVDGVYYKLQAESLNGQISVRSSVIGGDWSVYSAVGEIDLQIPELGDYALNGSSGYGEIKTNLPFEIDNKTIKGTLLTGKYKINVEGNSDLIVRRYSN